MTGKGEEGAGAGVSDSPTGAPEPCRPFGDPGRARVFVIGHTPNSHQE